MMTDLVSEHRDSTQSLEESSLPLQNFIRQKKQEGIEDTSVKDYISTLASEIPDHIFHYEWFEDEEELSGQFIGVAKKLLPTLVLGVEKLLREVEKKGLTEEENVCPNFNPLNFLAQFMLRNHPRSLTVSERSAYIKMLESVTKKINEQFDSDKKKSLMTMKEKIRKRRLEREETKAIRQAERSRHKALLSEQFYNWIRPDKQQLQLSTVVKALNALDEMLSEPLDEFEVMLKELKTSQAEKVFDKDSYSEFLLDYLDNSNATFEMFLEHMNKSAEANNYLIKDEEERRILLDLFKFCDESILGLLNRQKVINILEEIWLLCPVNMTENFNNPSTWPVIEVEETGLVMAEPSDELSDLFLSSDEGKNDIENADTESRGTRGHESETGEQYDNYMGDEDATKNGNDTTNKDDDPTKDVDNEASEDYVVTAADDDTGGDEVNYDDTPAEDNKAIVKDDKEDNEDVDEEELEEDEKGDDEIKKKLSGDYSSEFTSTGPEFSVLTSKAEELENLQLENWLRTIFTDIDMVSESQENIWQLKMEDALQRHIDTQVIAKKKAEIKSFVSFGDEVTVFRDEKVEFEPISAKYENAIKAPIRSIEPSPSAFAKYTLTSLQFVQLLKSFLSEEHSKLMFDVLVGCFYENYRESREERALRMRKINQEEDEKYFKSICNSLFEMWDSNQSGHVATKVIENVIRNYIKHEDEHAVKIYERELEELAKKELLSKQEFRQLIRNIADCLPDTYQNFIDYASSRQISKIEVTRGGLRKEWYRRIINAGRTSGVNMEAVYEIVFNTLYKDAETHGNGKTVSSYIALLTCEESVEETFLKYVASTPDQAEYLENQTLRRKMNCISFTCIDKGLPVHVPKVRSHGRVYFWNTNEKHNGSLLLIPLKNKKNLVFGLMGVDTLQCPSENCVFVAHEIKFYEGIAKAFSIAYHCTKMRKWMMIVLESAVRWLEHHCCQIEEVTIYIVEPNLKEYDLRLKTVMTMDSNGVTTMLRNPSILRRKASLFKNYLFYCMDSSMTVSAISYEQYHIAYPIRGKDGLVYLIMDITTCKPIKQFSCYEQNELMRILRLLQIAHQEIWHELWDSEEPNTFLAAEQQKHKETLRIAVMFDRFLLMDLRENIVKINENIYDELAKQHDPPRTFYNISKAVISILYPESIVMEDSEDWASLKEFIKPELGEKVNQFDPTATENDFDVDTIKTFLKDISPCDAMKLGFWPSDHFYFWLHVCVSLREHLKANSDDPHKINIEQSSVTELNGSEANIQI